MKINLIFVPSSQIDANDFNQLVDEAGYHAEWDVRNGRFVFEEDEDLVDKLEMALTNILDTNDINGYFETENIEESTKKIIRNVLLEYNIESKLNKQYLIFVPSSDIDRELFRKYLEYSDFFAEEKYGSFYFKYKDENHDELKKDIEKDLITKRVKINGYYDSEYINESIKKNKKKYFIRDTGGSYGLGNMKRKTPESHLYQLIEYPTFNTYHTFFNTYKEAYDHAKGKGFVLGQYDEFSDIEFKEI